MSRSSRATSLRAAASSPGGSVPDSNCLSSASSVRQRRQPATCSARRASALPAWSASHSLLSCSTVAQAREGASAAFSAFKSILASAPTAASLLRERVQRPSPLPFAPSPEPVPVASRARSETPGEQRVEHFSRETRRRCALRIRAGSRSWRPDRDAEALDLRSSDRPARSILRHDSPEKRLARYDAGPDGRRQRHAGLARFRLPQLDAIDLHQLDRIRGCARRRLPAQLGRRLFQVAGWTDHRQCVRPEDQRGCVDVRRGRFKTMRSIAAASARAAAVAGLEPSSLTRNSLRHPGWRSSVPAWDEARTAPVICSNPRSSRAVIRLAAASSSGLRAADSNSSNSASSVWQRRHAVTCADTRARTGSGSEASESPLSCSVVAHASEGASAAFRTFRLPPLASAFTAASLYPSACSRAFQSRTARLSFRLALTMYAFAPLRFSSPRSRVMTCNGTSSP